MGKAFLFGIGGGGGDAKPEQTKSVALSMGGGNQVITPDATYVLTQVTIQKPSTMIAGNIKSGVDIGGIVGNYTGGGVTLPTLHAPTISRNGSTLILSNPSSNGTYVSGYRIYANGNIVSTQSGTTFNLNSLDPGTYTITATVYGTNFNDSSASNSVSYSVYSITNNLTDLTTSNSATKIGMSTAYSATLSPVSGKYLPSSITVTMGGSPAIFTYNNDTGALAISSVTGNVIITAAAEDLPKLAATTIDLVGSILSWTSVTNATVYSIRSNGTQIATSTGNEFDLSTVLTDNGSYVITVVAQASGYRDSNPSNTKTYIIGAQPIYGVSGLYASTPALTRTDDAIGMSFSINSSTGAIASDFNDVFPWTDAEVVEDALGNKFVEMPDMWFRIGRDASNNITDIAVSKQEGATGDWYKVDSFRYSCYGGSKASSALQSVTGATRLHTQTRAQFRTAAAANGSGYFQEDLYHKNVMMFLWWIEWATKDSASIMTGRIANSGTSGGNSMRPTGGTDNVTTPSGFETAYAQMRYHYIEDFVGNLYEFVDGSVGTGSSGGIQYVTADPTKFADSTTNLNASFNSPTTSGNCIAAFGWDVNNPFLCLPKVTVSNSSYNTYFCDYGEKSNNIVLYCGAGWNYSTAYFGLSSFNRSTASFSDYYIGGRLMYKSAS